MGHPPLSSASHSGGGLLFSIHANNVAIADLTLTRAFSHPIHISGPGTTIQGTLIHNVTIVDPGEQAFKINSQELCYAD